MSAEYQAFDIAHMDWNEDTYFQYALSVPIEKTGKLLKAESFWRKEHRQNVVASISGWQGLGKSMPFGSFGIMLGNIFGIQFTAKDVYFDAIELNEALKEAKPCQTFFKDEETNVDVGEMANLVKQNLASFEEQLRINQNNLLFASVKESDHANFFSFKAMTPPYYNEKKYPEYFVVMLYTPLFKDNTRFVARGRVAFPMPPKDFVEAYEKRKKEHIRNLQVGYGGSTLNPVERWAEKLFNLNEKNLVRSTKEGFIIPLQSELMDVFIANHAIVDDSGKHGFGTTAFTVYGKKILLALIKEKIEQKYSESNFALKNVLSAEREVHRSNREDIKKKELEELRKRQDEREKRKREELVERKRLNDLKEKLILIKLSAIKPKNKEVLNRS